MIVPVCMRGPMREWARIKFDISGRCSRAKNFKEKPTKKLNY